VAAEKEKEKRDKFLIRNPTIAGNGEKRGGGGGNVYPGKSALGVPGKGS